MRKLMLMLLLVVGNAQAFTWSDYVTSKDPVLGREVQVPMDTYKLDRPGPTIIIGHACVGLGPADRMWAHRLRSWGYNVVIPNSFSERGYATVCGRGRSVSPVQRNADLDAVAEWINKQPWHQGSIGYIGFSHGGEPGLLLANRPANKLIKAVVVYYPHCNPKEYQRPNIPVQIHIGALDDWSPAKACYELEEANEDYDLNVYEGSHHNFDRPGLDQVVMGRTIRYNQWADDTAQARTKEFFKEHVK